MNSCSLIKKVFYALFLTLFLFFNLFTPQTILAKPSGGGLVVSPAFEEVVLEKADETKTIPLQFTNNTQASLSLDIFPIDFKEQDAYGQLSFLGQQSGSYSYSLSSFLSLESNVLILEPNETKTFKVTVKNRDDLSPGGHYAAIVAKLSAKNESKDTTVLAPSISSLILLRKTGGERFNLSLVGTNTSETVRFSQLKDLTLLFQNEGNIHVVPYGTVIISDFLGRTLYKGIINTNSSRVFPESRRYINVDLMPINKGLPISLNSIKISGQDSLKKVSYNLTDSYLYIDPLFLLFVTLIFILLIIFIRKVVPMLIKKKVMLSEAPLDENKSLKQSRSVNRKKR